MAKRVKTDNYDFDAWVPNNLPPEILNIILEKLFHLSDYIRFGAVCKSWNSAAVYQIQKRAAAVHEQPPMLLFINPEDYTDSNGFFKLGRLAKLYSIGEERLYESGFRFDMSEFSDDEVLFAGSAYGWLAMVVGKCATRSSIRLLNPFIQKDIEIPAIPKMYGFVRKIIMSCDPLKHPDQLFLAAWMSSNKIAITKLGEKSWAIINPDSYNYPIEMIRDIVFHKGLLYMVDSLLTLVEIDYKNSYICYYDRRQRKQLYNFKAAIVVALYGFRMDRLAWSFLVEASNGDLLIVQSDNDLLLISGPDSLRACKLVKHQRSSAGYWRKMETLNDDAIYVSDKSCLCIPAAASGGKPNSVYFGLNYWDQRYDVPDYSLKFRRSDTAIYNLGDQTLRNMGGLDYSICPIALLSPSMC